MIRILDDMPDGVLGFEAEGEIHADDYRDVLIPAIESHIAEGGKVRAVIVFPEFAGMSAGATWEDLTFGVENLTRWKRIALVTDVEWMVHVVHLFGWMTPGAVKVFPLDQRDAAVAWAAADD